MPKKAGTPGTRTAQRKTNAAANARNRDQNADTPNRDDETKTIETKDDRAPQQQATSRRRFEMDMSAMNQPMEHMEKAAQKIMQACEEAGSLSREHMDATMRSANVAWEGCTEINRNMSSLVQESMARAMNAGKTMMAAKSVREVMDMQTEFMKEFMDCWVSGTGKISEISARVTQNAMSPLAEHANNAMGKMAQRVKAVA